MFAFLGYQTSDKHAAGEVQDLLKDLGIKAFLAQDIEVSHEWRGAILREIKKVDLSGLSVISIALGFPKGSEPLCAPKPG